MLNRTRRWGWIGVGGVAALLGLNGDATARTPAEILAFQPRQVGVDCTTPPADQHAACKLDVAKLGKNGSAWVLKDAKGAVLRQFADANGDKKVDTWSFYKDGVEVYREMDGNANGKPDQYRWLNGGGMKWGVDPNEDGKIDGWKAISPEEVSQEVLAAVATRDPARFQALLLGDADLKALDLAAPEAKRLRDALAGVRAKFDEATGKTKGIEKAAWLHLETGVPQCKPGEEAGKGELVSHPRGTILYEANGKNDWLQTGEMVKVGDAWRLVEGPSVGGSIDKSPMNMATAAAGSPKMQKLIEELAELDKAAPASRTNPGPNPEVVKHSLKRTDVLEKIVAEVDPKERELWIRQVADSLGSALQSAGAEDKTPAERMDRLEKQLVAAMPAGHSLPGYVVYRRLHAEYSASLVKPNADYAKIQQEWIEKLSKFIVAYPQADDAPDALLQLGMVNEFLAKEIEAKKWYAQLAKDHADKPQAAKGQGAVRRLELEGKEMPLTGTTVDGASFDMSKAKGKTVVVYFWASSNQQAVGDFAKLKLLLDSYGAKGLEVVGVNLDYEPAEAQAFLKRVTPPGRHIHQPGGHEGKLATDYGIMVLPSVFLVGGDGKVLSRTLQVNNLEDELKKIYK